MKNLGISPVFLSGIPMRKKHEEYQYIELLKKILQEGTDEIYSW